MSQFLIKCLKLNAIYSGAMGFIMVVFTIPIAEFMGNWLVWIPAAIGAGLILFALDLVWLSQKLLMGTFSWRRLAVHTVILMDILWVIGAAVLLIIHPAWMSANGLVTLAIISLPVLALALSQWVGLLRSGRDKQAQQAMA